MFYITPSGHNKIDSFQKPTCVFDSDFDTHKENVEPLASFKRYLWPLYLLVLAQLIVNNFPRANTRQSYVDRNDV